MPRAAAYVPLWCKSHYSFLEGASSPEQYAEQAAELGLSAIALTDRDGVYGAVKGHFAALEHGTRIIPGAQVTVREADGPEFSLAFLASDSKGYANLCSLITTGRMRSDKGASSVTLQECLDHADGMHALWLPLASRAYDAKSLPLAIDAMKQAFAERFSMMICRHRETSDPVLNAQTAAHAKRHQAPTVAAFEVLYHSARQRQVQDVLNCIRNHRTIADCARLVKPNACHALVSAQEFRRAFRDVPESVARTLEIAEDCAFRIDSLRYDYPRERGMSPEALFQRLREQTMRGAEERYSGRVPGKVLGQLEAELKLINKLNYGSYFLTMHRIVQWCRRNDILCQGRGSAANSAVCYCLGITSIDPVSMDLLFERFLSPERNEPPDIDLDIEHARREEVIQHVYRTYGRERAAMVATVIRYRSRSATRDVGTVFGMSKTALHRLSKQLDSHDGIREEHFSRAGLDPSLRTHQLVMDLSNSLIGVPRHLSIHPGGFIFTSGRIQEMVPVENAAMPGRTVIQWEKEDIEAMKIFKVDLLGLGALTQLHHCFDLIRQTRGKTLDMSSVPQDDRDVFAMLRKADTVGVFQIESRAQMSMLPRLKPREWYDLVVQIAIVRPGPISGGMVHPYLRRRAGEEQASYPHPCLIPVLGKTLGIPIFQEQVIKLAVVAADYEPGEADQLRRDMAAWGKEGRLERHREKLIARMASKGIRQEFAEQVFEQIRGFGEYGFPESHSASFALIAYAASYLKCHYPAEFACSLLNSQPMGFYSPSTIIEDARRHGVRILPASVLFSGWNCEVKPCPESAGGFALRIGLRYVKGLSKRDGEALQAAQGEIRSIEELAQETRISKSALGRLAEAGALRDLAANRRSAIWQARGISDRPTLMPMPGDEVGFESLTAAQASAWDYRAMGVSESGHILSHHREQLTAEGLPDAKTVNALADGAHVRYAGAVICRQRPANAGSVVFMTLEDETGFVNVIFWPKCFERNQHLAKSLALMGVSGRLQVAEDVVHLVASSVWDPGDVIPWKHFKARNFR